MHQICLIFVKQGQGHILPRTQACLHHHQTLLHLVIDHTVQGLIEGQKEGHQVLPQGEGHPVLQYPTVQGAALSQGGTLQVNPMQALGLQKLSSRPSLTEVCV